MYIRGCKIQTLSFFFRKEKKIGSRVKTIGFHCKHQDFIMLKNMLKQGLIIIIIIDIYIYFFCVEIIASFYGGSLIE